MKDIDFQPLSREDLEPMADEMATRYGIPNHIFKGLVDHESSWNPYAKNPKSSARGLGQHLDSTLKNMGYTPTNGPDDPRNDPVLALELTAKHLIEKYNATGNWRTAVKSYGEGTEAYMKRVSVNISKYFQRQKKAPGILTSLGNALGPGQAQAAEGPAQEYTFEPLQPGEIEFEPIEDSGGIGDQKAVNKPSLSTAQQTTRTIAPALRQILEIGGLTLGVILATPGTMGLGSAAGAGLGYASGRKLADTLEAYAGMKKPQTLGETAMETAKDVAFGATLEAGGQALAGIGKHVASWLGERMAPKLYESALKMPPVAVPPDIRKLVVQKGLEGKYIPNQASLARLEKESQALVKEISTLVDRGARAGKTIDTAKILSRVDELGKFYENLPDPRPYLEHLAEAKAAIQEFRGTSIPVNVAQSIKKNLYVNLRKSYGEMKTIIKEFDKAVARGIKEELENQLPGLSEMNKRLAEKINLEQVLERSVHRIRNYDIIRLGDVVAATAGAAAEGPEGLAMGYLVKRALDFPETKARLAILLKRLAPAVGRVPVLNPTSRTVPYASALAGRSRE